MQVTGRGGAFAVAAAGFAIVPEDAVPVLFAARGAGAPAEPDHGVGAVRDLLECNVTDLAGAGVPVEHVPSTTACGLFHDPEILFLEGTDQVGAAGGAVFDFRIGPYRIVVPGRHIKVHGQIVRVGLRGAEGHEVMRDEMPGAEGTQHHHLFMLEADVQPGVETPPIETGGGVMMFMGGGLDLTPGLVKMPPEMRAPRLVEGLQGPVARAKPVLPFSPAGVAIAVRAIDFVVGLPSDHAGVVVVMSGHGAGDALGQEAVGAVGETVVLAQAPDNALSSVLNRQRVGIFACQPGRHDGRGGAEYNGDPLATQHVDGVVQPVKFKAAFLRFEHHPGKFRESDHVEAGLFHEAGIGFPTVAGPVFGVIVGANIHGELLPPPVAAFGEASRVRFRQSSASDGRNMIPDG